MKGVAAIIPRNVRERSDACRVGVSPAALTCGLRIRGHFRFTRIGSCERGQAAAGGSSGILHLVMASDGKAVE